MNVGGTATYLANLIHGLEKLGVNNLLVMGNVPRGESEDAVVEQLNFHRVESLSRELNIQLDRKARAEIEEQIREFKPDIIHTHTFKAGFLVRLGRRATPVIHSFHGHHLYDPEFGFVKRTVLNFLERRLAVRSDALVTIGKQVRDELLEVGIGNPNQFFPIAPGIELLELKDEESIRAKFSFDANEVLVVWLGRFTEVKRPDRVIDIARMNPDLTFVMAGGGELLDSLKSTASSNVRFLGFQDKNEMWSIADVALCTSDSEGMPLSLIEAQMAGVPVVSTNVGSVSEIVEDGITGRLAKRDVAELSSAIREVVTSIHNNSDLGNAARSRALKEFSSQVMAEAHMKLYEKVLGKVSR
jgi:glycosyltransferase involved in cell wall biosynthesis